MSPDAELEDLLRLLILRFGPDRSLGEVYATSYALHQWRKGQEISLTDIAKATGLPKQNLSRWLRYQISIGQAKAETSEDDRRRQEIGITDPVWALRHLERVAEILGAKLDLPRRR